MRYTTIIDVSADPLVYRNMNARLLYLHMALKSGWHDDDRDRLTMSIRQLAAGAGLTVSATRHAIAVLTKAKLISRDSESGVWTVKKWHLDTPPTPRPRKSQATAATAEHGLVDKMEDQVRRYQDAVLKAVRECTREELEAWLAELREHRSVRHHGAAIAANQQNIDWLSGVIAKM